MSIILPILLCFSYSLEAITIHFVQKFQTIFINPIQLIILSEIIKFFICSLLYSVSEYETQNTITNIHWYILPSIFYMISNFLTYISLLYLTPPMFNLLSNLKIPITTLLAFFFLHRKSFNSYQFLTIVFIFFGNSIAFYSSNLIFNNKGLVYMIIYSLCSGSAAVYSEYILKYKFKDENIFLQSIKFCICSIFFNLIFLIGSDTVLIWDIELIHLLSILSMSLNGIFTALVLKYNGSIVKTYSASLSVFVSMIMSYFIYNYQISLYFTLGVIISFTGINIFLYDKYKKSQQNDYNIPYQLIVNLEEN